MVCRRVATLATLVALAGCTPSGGNRCLSDGECRDNRLCLEGVCAYPESAPEVAPDPGQFADLTFEATEEPLVAQHTCDCEKGGSAFRYILFLRANGAADLYFEEGLFGHGFNPLSELPDQEDTRVRWEEVWDVDDAVLNVGDAFVCRPPSDPEALELLECDVTRDDLHRVEGSPLGFRTRSLLDDLDYDSYRLLEPD